MEFEHDLAIRRVNLCLNLAIGKTEPAVADRFRITSRDRSDTTIPGNTRLRRSSFPTNKPSASKRIRRRSKGACRARPDHVGEQLPWA
jgi:hypothetical protein